jgi:hypothetical protein
MFCCYLGFWTGNIAGERETTRLRWLGKTEEKDLFSAANTRKEKTIIKSKNPKRVIQNLLAELPIK